MRRGGRGHGGRHERMTRQQSENAGPQDELCLVMLTAATRSRARLSFKFRLSGRHRTTRFMVWPLCDSKKHVVSFIDNLLEYI